MYAFGRLSTLARPGPAYFPVGFRPCGGELLLYSDTYKGRNCRIVSSSSTRRDV
jgi:hypothetical protein